MTDYVVSNQGVCTSIAARMDAFMGFPDGRGTDRYANVREHASKSGVHYIILKEVYGPNGKVMMSDIIAQLEAAEVANIMTHDELVADGGIPNDTI